MEQEFNKEQLADDYGKTWLGSDIAWLAAANGFLAGWDACEQKLKQCNVSGALPLHEYIDCMNKHMAEMYMRHDYRSMYEIWEKVSELAKLETTRQ